MGFEASVALATREEGERAVEHWDNIQARHAPNKSNRNMVDGPTTATDHEQTEYNRSFVRSFVKTVLIAGQHERTKEFLDADSYMEHNPHLADGLLSLRSALAEMNGERRNIDYHRVHRGRAAGGG